MHVKATVFHGDFCSNPSGFHMADSIDFKYLITLENALKSSVWCLGLVFLLVCYGLFGEIFFLIQSHFSLFLFLQSPKTDSSSLQFLPAW